MKSFILFVCIMVGLIVITIDWERKILRWWKARSKRKQDYQKQIVESHGILLIHEPKENKNEKRKTGK